jgi:DNA ligase (NAD+)
VRSLATEDLTSVKGIKEAIASAIVEGLDKRREIIDDLLREITVPDAPAPAAPASDGALAGMSFVFTGTLQAFDRKTAQTRAVALGAETPAGVSKSLTHLVVGAGKAAKSSKQKKAEQLVADGASIEIISEDDFLQLLTDAGG